MVKRDALPFEEQRSYNGALFFQGINRDQLVALYTDLLGFTNGRAEIVLLIVAQFGISSQPAKGGRVVTLINSIKGYDVALDVF